MLSAERGRFQENLALQAQKWKEYSESITEDAETALLSSRAERDEAETEIDHLFSALIDARTELEEWDEWYASHYPPEGVREQELLEEPPQVCPATPPVVQSTIPSEFLPPPRPRSFAEPRARAEEGGMDASRVAPGQPSSSAFPTFAPTTPQQLILWQQVLQGLLLHLLLAIHGHQLERDCKCLSEWMSIAVPQALA